MQNETVAEASTTHYHEVTLISGKILNIEPLGSGKLSQIFIEGFESMELFFYNHTINEEHLIIGETPVFGIVDFHISDKLNELSFDGNSKSGTLIFDISGDECREGNTDPGGAKTFVRNFVAEPSEKSCVGGTKACAPCKFIVHGKMIQYTIGDFSYFPMVTFPDGDNYKERCYFSFFKCRTNEVDMTLNEAHPKHIYGFDDDPRDDEHADVLIHDTLNQ